MNEIDPFKNFTPRSNPQAELPKETPLTAEQLADKGYLRDLALTELVAIVMKNKGDIKGVPAVKELLDRSEGKPAQAMTLDANLNVVQVTASIEFIRATGERLENVPVDKLQVIDN